MTKLTLIALLTASADGMFSMGDMMKDMTDTAKDDENRDNRYG